MSVWHIITCEFPPQIGGVSDYSQVVASSLAARHSVHVWCPGVPEAAAARPDGVTVHRSFGSFSASDLGRVGAQLSAFPAPRQLFVQWVPQGFGYRSLNLGFAIWLAFRAWIVKDRVQLMVHEAFLPWSAKPAWFVAAIVQRLMFWIVGNAAARVWVSTTTWRAMIQPFIWTGVPIEWLPIPVPSAEASTEAVAAPASSDRVVVGHFSSYSSTVTPLLRDALVRVLDRTSVSALLLGSGSDAFHAALVEQRPDLATRVRASGVIAPDDVGTWVRQCSVMIQPYPDGITSRRTSTLTLLAQGRAVVTNAGALTEAFWHDADAVCLVPTVDGGVLGDAVVTLIDDAPARHELSRQARLLYDRLFDARHLIGVLERAAATV